MVLSSLGDAGNTWSAVLSALMIQLCLAMGRLIGGRISDRCQSVVVLAAAVGILFPSVVGFINAGSYVHFLLAAAITGFVSGVGQTAALSAMMRHSDSSRAAERSSAGWNVVFDRGLGFGALAVGWMASHV